MNESFLKMKRKTMDLMQAHNLQDWQTNLKTLKGWKEEGKVRYVGNCVIPGTSDKKHLIDNMVAGYGKLPDESGLKMMLK